MDNLSLMIGGFGGVGGTIAVLKTVGWGFSWWMNDTIVKRLQDPKTREYIGGITTELIDQFVDRLASGKDPLVETFFESAMNARLAEFMKGVLNGRYPMKDEVNARFARIDDQLTHLPVVIAGNEEFLRRVRHTVRNVMHEFMDAQENSQRAHPKRVE